MAGGTGWNPSASSLLYLGGDGGVGGLAGDMQPTLGAAVIGKPGSTCSVCQQRWGIDRRCAADTLTRAWEFGVAGDARRWFARSKQIQAGLEGCKAKDAQPRMQSLWVIITVLRTPSNDLLLHRGT